MGKDKPAVGEEVLIERKNLQEIWDLLESLDLSPVVNNEVIERLKYIPPAGRRKYLEETFPEVESYHDDF